MNFGVGVVQHTTPTPKFIPKPITLPLMNINKQFDDKGYAILKEFFSPDEIKNITEIVDRIYAQWLDENGDECIKHQLINMHALTHLKYFEGKSDERIRFFELIASQKLTDVLETMFGEELYFHNTQLFFNPYQQGKRPYWHRDLQYSPIDDAMQAQEQNNMLTLHVRTPLVAEKGVELIPYTHKRWDSQLERNVRFELNGHTNSDVLPGAVLIELEPGDVLIFSAQMIHRGNYELNPMRKAFDLCVGKPHPWTSAFIDEEILPTDDEIDCIPNDQWYERAREIAANKAHD